MNSSKLSLVKIYSFIMLSLMKRSIYKLLKEEDRHIMRNGCPSSIYYP